MNIDRCLRPIELLVLGGVRSVEALMDVARNARLTFRGIVVRDETSERAARGVVRGR
ncbi:hypothetical protein [Burkholderia ubonensis]|uniref:hypothetical protein n=1 Tax=Burkholderia ubonensis TaxID=101571 RepID=UPI001E643DD8|nr:hypothetical protein [Burkholderia ubonensis]